MTQAYLNTVTANDLRTFAEQTALQDPVLVKFDPDDPETFDNILFADTDPLIGIKLPKACPGLMCQVFTTTRLGRITSRWIEPLGGDEVWLDGFKPNNWDFHILVQYQKVKWADHFKMGYGDESDST